MPLLRNPKDFYAGLLFMAFGLMALVIARSYPLGTASRMGPGYFPRILGILLLSLGALLSLRGFRSGGEAMSRWHWRPLSIVLLSVLVWGLAAQWLGLVVASLALVFVSSVASDEFGWREALVSGAIQAASVVAVFVYGLGVPLPVWPVFLGGGR
ncbi:MAG TPA: tripartite tricarboxylate transporter TctB family protein [Candidatus Methylomirabilis sp.]|nr:tripartite tricarboxylate transporter TctB family protein [Candidatus Methylomirabilis sp.]